MQALADTPWKLEEAQKDFGTVMEAALSGNPQVVQRASDEAVVVVSLADFERLTKRISRSQSRGSFIEHLLAYPGDEVERVEVEPRPVEF